QGNTYSTITTNDIVVYALPPTPILTAEFGNVTATNASGNSIEWFLDGTLLNTTANPLSTLINGIYQSGTYSAIYTNSFGCTSQIGVITTIQPTMQLSSTAVCPGEQITFLNTTDPIQGMSCVFIPYLNGPNYNLDPYESIVLDLDYSGSFISQLICTAQAVIGSNNYSYTVTNIPNTPQITESNNTLTAYNTSANDQLQWYYNGNAIGNTNPISVLNGEIYQDGFYYVTVVNSSGCSNQSDSVLILHPSFTQSESQICPNDSVTFTNTTAIIEGLTCSLNDGLGNNYNFDETLTIYYPTNGYFYPEITCSLAGNTFSDVGLPILVFSPPDAPQLLAQFGAIICNNCNGLPTDYYLNNEYLVTSNFNISTYINGSYLNGYYSAQLVNSQGCLSPLSDSVLLIHPLYSTSAHGGCAPLEITFTNTTENISGLNCELSVNPQLSNVSLPVGESFSYQYNLPDYYETSLVCTLNNQTFYSLTDIISVNGNTVPDLVQIGDTV
ncbi:MAG: hypothetical protein ACKO8Q_10165, partial [Bacteroidota bacterium]